MTRQTVKRKKSIPRAPSRVLLQILWPKGLARVSRDWHPGGPSRDPEERSMRLDGETLGLKDVEAFLDGEAAGAPVRVEVAPAARARVQAGRAAIERILAHGETVYGVNTGFG